MTTIAKQSKDAIQDTKKYIISTARRFFSEYSYLGVSMSDIAEKLNITKAALYYHFAGKAEIYEKVLDSVFVDLSLSIAQALSEPTIDKRLHKLIKNYLIFGLREKNLIKALMLKLSPNDDQITKHIAQLREQIVNLIYPIIDEVSMGQKSAKKVDSRILTSIIVSMMDGLLLEYSFLNKKIDSSIISNQICDIILKA